MDMLCQNCGKNEAVTHLRRVINGETAETHLCSRCAAALGGGMGFSPFAIGLGGLFDGFFSEAVLSSAGKRTVRCEKCGCSFDDIVKNGKLGCAGCLNTFYDRISESFENIHGKAVYEGTVPASAQDDAVSGRTVEQLKEMLNRAIDEQDFELAAQLRDEIRERTGL